MMSKKAYRAMYNGWSGNFRRNVMPLINEDIFAPLYSEKKSRPAEPVNVLFSIFLALSLFCGMSPSWPPLRALDPASPLVPYKPSGLLYPWPDRGSIAEGPTVSELSLPVRTTT